MTLRIPVAVIAALALPVGRASHPRGVSPVMSQAPSDASSFEAAFEV